MFAVGRPDELEAALGLNPLTAQQIAAILIFAGNVEFRLERAIWRLQSHIPKGVRHATDSKPVMALIEMFEAEGAVLPDGPQHQLIECWCATARVAFEYRHSIAHGVVFRMDTAMRFERNQSWEGEIRKRSPASLCGDPHTFDDLRLTFAVLLRVINSVSNERRPIDTVANPAALEALTRAKSRMFEMASGHGPLV